MAMSLPGTAPPGHNLILIRTFAVVEASLLSIHRLNNFFIRIRNKGPPARLRHPNFIRTKDILNRGPEKSVARFNVQSLKSKGINSGCHGDG